MSKLSASDHKISVKPKSQYGITVRSTGGENSKEKTTMMMTTQMVSQRLEHFSLEKNKNKQINKTEKLKVVSVIQW